MACVKELWHLHIRTFHISPQTFIRLYHYSRKHILRNCFSENKNSLLYCDRLVICSVCKYVCMVSLVKKLPKGMLHTISFLSLMSICWNFIFAHCKYYLAPCWLQWKFPKCPAGGKTEVRGRCEGLQPAGLWGNSNFHSLRHKNKYLLLKAVVKGAARAKARELWLRRALCVAGVCRCQGCAVQCKNVTATALLSCVEVLSPF